MGLGFMDIVGFHVDQTKRLSPLVQRCHAPVSRLQKHLPADPAPAPDAAPTTAPRRPNPNVLAAGIDTECDTAAGIAMSRLCKHAPAMCNWLATSMSCVCCTFESAANTAESFEGADVLANLERQHHAFPNLDKRSRHVGNASKATFLMRIIIRFKD